MIDIPSEKASPGTAASTEKPLRNCAAIIKDKDDRISRLDAAVQKAIMAPDWPAGAFVTGRHMTDLQSFSLEQQLEAVEISKASSRSLSLVMHELRQRETQNDKTNETNGADAGATSGTDPGNSAQPQANDAEAVPEEPQRVKDAEDHRAISDIKNPCCYRKDLGDIEGLAESIRTLGLFPGSITITRSDDLVFGRRCLAACKHLGWDTVPVSIWEGGVK